MNRGPAPVSSTAHPSTLALEQLLAGQGTAETTSHLLTCEACRLHLSAMEASARKFSASPKSLRAREAATHADRRWKRRAASLTAATVAALALISFGAPRLISRPTPQADTIARAPQNQPGALRRQAREVLEPRPEVWPSRLRKLPIRGRDVEFGQGSLEAATDDGPSRPFTLTHTRVDINVTGFMQAVAVTQTFKNPFNTPVEAVYVFPLPDDAAVHAMEMRAGNRLIKAEIQKREQARATYEQAKSQGRRAALLDQERPNIFTQSLANLLPGETVEITISYVAPLAYDDGVYTLDFPMTVGPRYIPGAALDGESQGTGTARDTDQVVDASRITPPHTRAGRDIEVNIRVDAGTVIEDVWTVSHRLQIDRLTSARVDVQLDPYDTIPNKDLILRWRVSGPTARAAILAAGGSFALMLNPEAKQTNAPVTPKEMVFVIDTSCSMNGPPLDAAKLAMEQALTQMNPLDTFMLIDFAETASSFHDSALPASQANVERAVNYLRNLRSRGGTNQLAGIRRALAREEDPSHLRMVLLMTDGYIGNEDEILAETKRLRGGARVFGFGVGSSVNHYLLSRLSEEGRGFYQYVRPDEDPSEAVARFVRRVRRPLITDITIDWNGLPVADVLPNPIVDLFDAQPLIINGRYKWAARGTVVLKGRRGNQSVVLEVPVTLPELNTDGHALAMAWARKRIEKLSASQYGTPRADAIDAITMLGLEYHLVTPYTSLVAVEQERVSNVQPVTVTEPALTPDQPNAVVTAAVTTPVSKPPPPANPYGGVPTTGEAGQNGLLGTLGSKGTGGRYGGAQGGDLSGALNGVGVISGLSGGEGQGGLGFKGVGAGGGGVSLGAGRGRGTMGSGPGLPNGGGHGAVTGGKLVVNGNGYFDSGGATGSTVTTTKPSVTLVPTTDTTVLKPADPLSKDPSPKVEPPPAKPAAVPDEPDFFEDAFGGSNKHRYVTEAPPPGEVDGRGLKGKGGKEVYIPPAPGSAPDTLTNADLWQVVINKKGELAACTAKKEAGTSGKIVIEWRIHTNGIPYQVRLAAGSEEFSGTPMAQCFIKVVSTMRFPRHAVEGESVKFPFKF